MYARAYIFEARNKGGDMLSDADKIEIVDKLGMDLYRVVPQRIIIEVLGLVSLSEMARRLNVKIAKLLLRIKMGLVPERQLQFFKNWYWTGPEADEIQRTWVVNARPRKVTPEVVASIWLQWLSGVHHDDIAANHKLHKSSVFRVLRKPKPQGL
jgi:hypothetical protein